MEPRESEHEPCRHCGAMRMDHEGNDARCPEAVYKTFEAPPTAAGLAAYKFLNGGCMEPGCDGKQTDTSPGGTWLYSCGHHVGK